MTCACLYHGPSHLPAYWSCPLAHSLGLPCLRGLPLWVWLGLFGSLPLGFLFAVLVGFSLGCLHLWCGLGALASRRHGVVCSRWAFALGVRGVLSWWAAVAAAVAAPSICAVYLGAVQIKVHTVTAEFSGFLSERHRKRAKRPLNKVSSNFG